MSRSKEKKKSRLATKQEFEYAKMTAVAGLQELKDKKMAALEKEYNTRLGDKHMNRKLTNAWYKAEIIKTNDAFTFLAGKIIRAGKSS